MELTPIRRFVLSAVFTIAVLILATGCGNNAPPPATAIQTPKTFAFWPEAPDAPHVQFVRSFNSSDDVTQGRSDMDKLLYGNARTVVSINKPYGVRMWNGRIYVCEIRGDKGMLVLDLRKNQSRLMGATGSITISKAVDIAVTPDGMKYVLDAIQSAVLVFDADEKGVSLFPLGRDTQPVGLAVHGQRLYIADFKNGRLLVLDRLTGKQLGVIGSRGGEDGQFVGPLAIATDKAGNVYVADTIRARVSKFSPDGKFLMAFGESGDRPGNFSRPKHLGVASNGEIYVVDANFNNVQVFDEKGQVLGYFGAYGEHLGSMDLPAGLDVVESDLDLFEKLIHPAFQAERLILVTNNFGGRKIAVYALGRLKEGKSVADIAPARAKLISGLTTQPVTAPLVQPSSRPAPAAIPSKLAVPTSRPVSATPGTLAPATRPAAPRR